MKSRQIPILPASSQLPPKAALVIPASVPRNPLVASARNRKAGAHVVSTGGKRQMQQRDLARRLWLDERDN
jgi:hypothetical protein